MSEGQVALLGSIIGSAVSIAIVITTVALAYYGWKLLKCVNTYRGWCRMFTYKSLTPIGPTHPIMGHMHLFRNQLEVYKLLGEVTKNTRTKLIGIWIGCLFPIINAVHPDTIKILLKSSAPKPMTITGYKGVIPWLGDGLLVSKGKKWERNRKLLTPAFHFDILKSYITIYNQVADTLVDKLSSLSESSVGSVEIYEPVGLAAFDTMLRCAFSYDSNVQEQGSSHPYVHAVKMLGTLIAARTMKPWQYWYPLYMLTPSGFQFRKYVNYVHRFDEDIIRKRTSALSKDSSLLEKRYFDFLDILLTAKDENGVGLTQREIRDEVDTFLFEGHDTTSSSITWAIYNLAKHQEEQENVYQEVIEVIRETSDIEWKDLNNLKRLGMFIRESIRHSTPVPTITRITTNETVLDGAVIPAGVQVLLNLHIVHNREDVWDDPEKFDPERFEDDKVKARDPYAYIPFSAGSRNCIGKQFALDEIKVVVAKIIRRFKVTVDPDNVAVQNPEFVMRANDNGVHVFLTERMEGSFVVT